MRVRLADLSVLLESEAEGVQEEWARLFAGWECAAEPEIALTLQQAGRLPADPVGLEQSERKLMRAAAFKADGDALVFEVAKYGRGRSFAQQDPQRLEADGAEPGQAGRHGVTGHAALDEGHVNAGYGIPEQAQVLDCAGGFEHFHAHSALLQELRIAQRKGIIGAALCAGGKPEGFGRRWPDKLPGHEKSRRGYDEGKAIN